MAEVQTGPKLGFFGPMKTLDSAQYGFEELPGGAAPGSNMTP